MIHYTVELCYNGRLNKKKKLWKPKGRRETENQGREESEEKANDTDPLSTVAFLSSFDQMLTELHAQ